ncbi:hypothetical protein Ciccas_009381 [Cichlidogyrus casuarinus]|uniref:Uncharacterized protein n=1 Tax=Cichlidogyrus casuarinus TaxID=1844966 RepID=A0ABD2PY65_9PLAT
MRTSGRTEEECAEKRTDGTRDEKDSVFYPPTTKEEFEERPTGCLSWLFSLGARSSYFPDHLSGHKDRKGRYKRNSRFTGDHRCNPGGRYHRRIITDSHSACGYSIHTTDTESRIPEGLYLLYGALKPNNNTVTNMAKTNRLEQPLALKLNPEQLRPRSDATGPSLGSRFFYHNNRSRVY